MTHYITFTIAGAHVKNSKDEIRKMKSIQQYKNKNADYSEEAYEAFDHNVAHGILVIYSINSALESVIHIISKHYGIEGEFFQRINELEKKIFLNPDIRKDLSELKKLRRFRNAITHWENDLEELLGTSFYLPYMMEDKKIKIKNKKIELISILSKEKLTLYFENLQRVLNDLYIYLKNNDCYLYMDIEEIKNGSITWNSG